MKTEEVAERHRIELIESSVMPDHIHAIVLIPSTMSLSKAFQLLKGASSYELFRRGLKFRLRYPKGHFWNAGKFYRSVGDVDLKTTKNYVRNGRKSISLRFPNTVRKPQAFSLWRMSHLNVSHPQTKLK